MELIIQVIFILCLSMVAYIYIGYPLLAFIYGLLGYKTLVKKDNYPSVTIVISAYNEAAAIENNLINKLNQQYPKDKLEIIVVSDGSIDETDAIVRRFETQGVKLIRQVPRAGKTMALNLAIPDAKGEIIIFSDANSIYKTDAVQKLVRNFESPDVGYVTGKMIYTNRDGTPIGDGCSAYMKYENILRKIETRLGSIIGVDGGIDAVRKRLYSPMKADQLPDFVLPLKVVEQGYRVVYEPEAILKEEALTTSHDEYKMRVRVSLRALWALYDMHHLLSVRRFGLFAVQLWSHKVLRYFCFVFLMGAFVANLYLWPYGVIYKILFAVQILGYMGAASLPYLEKRKWNPAVLRILYYFVLLNTASAHAFIKFMMGKKQILWTPRVG